MPKEIVVAAMESCPCRQTYECGCPTCLINRDILCDTIHPCEVFPPDCPLFENEYLIKRRNKNDVQSKTNDP